MGGLYQKLPLRCALIRRVGFVSAQVRLEWDGYRAFFYSSLYLLRPGTRFWGILYGKAVIGRTPLLGTSIKGLRPRKV